MEAIQEKVYYVVNEYVYNSMIKNKINITKQEKLQDNHFVIEIECKQGEKKRIKKLALKSLKYDDFDIAKSMYLKNHLGTK